MLVTACAPVRICDCGGWTDTWFARHGRVFNIAVRPCAMAQVRVQPGGGDRPPLFINADDLGISPGVNRGIVEAHRAGPLTSASLLVNMPASSGVW